MTSHIELRPGPRLREDWIDYYRVVGEFVYRCLCDTEKTWTFEKVRWMARKLYGFEVTLRFYHEVRKRKIYLDEFYQRSLELKQLKQSRPNQAASREGQSGARKTREPRSSSKGSGVQYQQNRVTPRRSHGKV